MNILVIGGSSLFGRYFLLQKPANSKITCIQRRNWSEIGVKDPKISDIPILSCGNLTSVPWKEVMKDFDGVINFLADGRVNHCETHPVETRFLNFELPAKLAKICAELKVHYTCFSSNVVFDGTKAPYGEADSLSPVGIYGTQKAELEREIADQALVVRTLFAYGKPFPKSFRTNPVFDLMISPPTKEILAVNDVWNNPVYAGDVAQFCWRAMESNLRGVFNVAGPDRLSRFDLFDLVFDLEGYSEAHLKAVPDSFFPGLPRPKDTTLSLEKAKKLNWKPTPSSVALQKLQQEIRLCADS